MRKVVLVVCLYGVMDASRSGIELRGYSDYLWSVAELIRKLYFRDKLAAVILCGGRTTDYCLTEAESVEPFLRYRLAELANSINILLERESRNTVQNIYNALKLALDFRFRAEILVVCDRVRALRAKVIARYLCCHANQLFGYGIAYKLAGVIGFPRQDTHPHSRWSYQLLAALRYFLFPSLIERDLAA